MARHFAHWLKAYIDYTESSEAPLTFHFWTGVWTLAGVLQRHVWRDEIHFQWVPNFYINLVAPPGVATKSTVMAIGKDLLAQVDGVKFGPDSGSWQGLGDALKESSHYFDYIGDAGKLETALQSPISIAASELGTFLHPDDEQAISFLTDIWDGKKGKYIHRTKHSGGIEIDNAWLNVLGATTPAWVRRNIKEAMIHEGLLSRTIFVYADKKRRLIALPSKRHHLDAGYRDKLIEDLKHIEKVLRGPFVFADDVYRDGGWMDTWYIKHQGVRPVSMASDRYAGYLSRKQTHMVKLAMILAAAKRDGLIIEQSDLEEAEGILVETEASMIRVFEAIGIVDDAKHVAEIVAFVRAYQWIPIDKLYFDCCYNIMSEKDFQIGFSLANRSGMIKVETRNGKQGLVPGTPKATTN